MLAWYGTEVKVRNRFAGGGFTVGAVVPQVTNRARTVLIVGILLRGRDALISASYLITQARQQVFWVRVGGQVAKISDHHRITVW